MPTEYEQGIASIQRRRAIAEAMQQNALSPLSAPLSGTGNYPIQTKISPLQIVSQLGQAYIARKQNQKLDKEYKDIAAAMASSKSKALRDLMIPQDMAPATSSDEGPTHAPLPSAENNFQSAQAAIDAGVDPAVVQAYLKKNGSQQSGLFGEVQPDKFTTESLAKFQKTKNYGDLVPKATGLALGKFNPGDYTPESMAAFIESKDPSVLVRYARPEIKEVAGGLSVITPNSGKPGGFTTAPVTTAAQETAAAAARKEAEARAQATGAGAGAVTADIIKKGSQAATVTDLLDLAEPLIGISTGSGAGAYADKIAAFFGGSPDGATAIAKLQTLSGQLIAQMPRMEGPQSDADRLLYQQAAGDLANPKIPRQQRAAAAQTIRQLQEKWKDRAASVGAPATPGKETAAQRAKRLGL